MRTRVLIFIVIFMMLGSALAFSGPLSKVTITVGTGKPALEEIPIPPPTITIYMPKKTIIIGSERGKPVITDTDEE